MEKKLYRSRDGKLICGVCAGIAAAAYLHGLANVDLALWH